METLRSLLENDHRLILFLCGGSCTQSYKEFVTDYEKTNNKVVVANNKTKSKSITVHGSRGFVPQSPSVTLFDRVGESESLSSDDDDNDENDDDNIITEEDDDDDIPKLEIPAKTREKWRALNNNNYNEEIESQQKEQHQQKTKQTKRARNASLQKTLEDTSKEENTAVEEDQGDADGNDVDVDVLPVEKDDLSTQKEEEQQQMETPSSQPFSHHPPQHLRERESDGERSCSTERMPSFLGVGGGDDTDMKGDEASGKTNETDPTTTPKNSWDDYDVDDEERALLQEKERLIRFLESELDSDGSSRRSISGAGSHILLNESEDETVDGIDDDDEPMLIIIDPNESKDARITKLLRKISSIALD